MKLSIILVSLCLVAFQQTHGFSTHSELRLPTFSIVIELDKSMKSMDEHKNIPALVKDLGLSTLYSAVVKAKLAEILSGKGPLTVFGPTNEAFNNLSPAVKEYIKDVDNLIKVLTYHVINGLVPSTSLKDELLVKSANGKNIRINLYPKGQESFNVATAQCAKIDLTKVDNFATNGIVHVVDNVLIPYQGNLVQTLGAKGNNFTTLVKALEIASLDTALEGEGPFTVFAPTDTAFKKIPPKALVSLLKNKKKLAELLKYHVVSGTYCSAGLTNGSLKTLNGENVAVKVSKDGVVINNSKVISADGSVSNGVYHTIDSVLLPPTFFDD